jgi:hypothetical protein
VTVKTYIRHCYDGFIRVPPFTSRHAIDGPMIGDHQGFMIDPSRHHHVTDMNPWYKTTVNPWYKTAVNPWYKTAVNPWYKTAVNPWYMTAVNPWYKTDMNPWYKTAMNPWYTRDRTVKKVCDKIDI